MIHRSYIRTLIVCSLVLLLSSCSTTGEKTLILEKNKVRIIFSENEKGPLHIALHALEKDFESVMNIHPERAEEMDQDVSLTEIVIINLASGNMQLPSGKLKELDGFESHRVYADPADNRIYLLGNDLRGTIYAIYAFSEKILGVPPLK